MENLKKRMGVLETLWKRKRDELIYTRDWRAEAYLRFEIIDLKREYQYLSTLLAASMAE